MDQRMTDSGMRGKQIVLENCGIETAQHTKVSGVLVWLFKSRRWHRYLIHSPFVRRILRLRQEGGFGTICLACPS